jgi:hypothetical protein
MGSVFKKTVTRPLPPGADFVVRQGVRLARWRDAKGKLRTAPLTTGKDGSDRIRDDSSTYFARYRDGNGGVEAPPSCMTHKRERVASVSLSWVHPCHPSQKYPLWGYVPEGAATPGGVRPWEVECEFRLT